MKLDDLYIELEQLFPEMVRIRRDLHKHPELSFQEERTPKMISDYLKNLGLEVRTGVGGRGVTGLLRGGKEGKTIALRADFDALPIQDEKEVPYKSQVDGVMHACGHDGHTATLLAVATVLSKHREDIKGNVVFIHQFAEELSPGGARPMIEDGCLDGVDAIFGAHLQNGKPLGELSYREGYMLASSDFFEIVLTGKGGHGANPHLAIDPLVTASQLVLNLQSIVSRSVDPANAAVLTVGSLHSGTAKNAIPTTAEIEGTVRTYDPITRDLIENKLKKITEYVSMANDVKCEIVYERGYDALWNHPEETNYIRELAVTLLGADKVTIKEAAMGSEDFAYYLQKVPGTFFFVGAQPEGPERVYPHHHSRFDFNEKAMLVAGKIFISAVLNFNK